MKKAFLIFLICTSALSSQVGIGDVVVDESAILEVSSTSQGVLFPRMSTTDRNNIANPAKGLIIFNTTTNSIDVNAGDSGTPSWETPADISPQTSYQGQSAKFTNTNTGININQANLFNIPLFDVEEWNDNSTLFRRNGKSVIVNETGRYKININVSFRSNSNNGRKAPELAIYINNTQSSSFASTGYMRRLDGAEESSLHLNEVLELNTGDVITVKSRRSANGNSVVLRSVESSNFYIEKLN